MTNRPLTSEEQEAVEKMKFQIMTSPQVTKEIVNEISQRIQSSKPLEEEYQRVIDENFWDLVKKRKKTQKLSYLIKPFQTCLFGI